MLELDEEVINVPRHADATTFAKIIPFDGDADEFVSCHVELNSMIFLEYIEEIVEVFDAYIFNPNVIDNKTEMYGTPFVTP